jgi:hypothetical protein
MTQDKIDQDIQTIKKIIEDKGFIFTKEYMRGPIALGNKTKNELGSIPILEKYGNYEEKVILEAGTFYLNYDDDLIAHITSPIFAGGPKNEYRRFSLYTLNYQVTPTNSDELLVSFRGSFW